MYLLAIRKSYQEIWRFLCGNKFLIATSCVVFIELIVFYVVNGVADDHYRTYVETTQGNYPNEFTFIFFENVRLQLLRMAVSIIPPFFGNLYVTMMVIRSFVATFKFLLFTLPIHTIFMGILPHGILEFSVLIFAFMLTNILSKEIMFGILRRISGKEISLWGNPIVLYGVRRAGVMLLSSIVLVIVPVLFFAAVIEVTISPMVLSALM